MNEGDFRRPQGSPGLSKWRPPHGMQTRMKPSKYSTSLMSFLCEP